MHARVISSRVMILVTSDAAPQPARARPGRPTEITDDHRVRHAVSALCDAALCGSGSPGTAIKFPYFFFRGVTVTVSQWRAAVKLETVTSKQGQDGFDSESQEAVEKTTFSREFISFSTFAKFP